MGYAIDCFKSYEVKNMMDWSGNYEFKMLEECNGDYISSSVLSKLNDYLEHYNLEILYNLVPNFGGNESFEGISKEEAEGISKRFIEPTKCIEYIIKNRIIEKIKFDKPVNCEEMVLVLEQLMNKWREGYYVYEWY